MYFALSFQNCGSRRCSSSFLVALILLLCSIKLRKLIGQSCFGVATALVSPFAQRLSPPSFSSAALLRKATMPNGTVARRVYEPSEGARIINRINRGASYY